MLLLKAKLLEARELPAQEPYPPSGLISVLTGTETRNLIGKPELVKELAAQEPFTDVWLELRDKQLRLEQFGGSGKGNVYRLSVVRVVDPKEIAR